MRSRLTGRSVNAALTIGSLPLSKGGSAARPNPSEDLARNTSNTSSDSVVTGVAKEVGPQAAVPVVVSCRTAGAGRGSPSGRRIGRDHSTHRRDIAAHICRARDVGRGRRVLPGRPRVRGVRSDRSTARRAKRHPRPQVRFRDPAFPARNDGPTRPPRSPSCAR